MLLHKLLAEHLETRPQNPKKQHFTVARPERLPTFTSACKSTFIDATLLNLGPETHTQQNSKPDSQT